jgi:hypothetical protein
MQSGKTTLSNFLHGHEMKRHDIIEKFLISPQGELVVNSLFTDENGNQFEDMGVLDLQQRSDEFYQFASRRIWPLIRAYNFADSLKEMCVMLFNIPPECVYGTDEQKNQVQEHLRWENMPGVITPESLEEIITQDGSGTSGDIDSIVKTGKWHGFLVHPAGPMTAREFMQFLGTDVMRKMYEPIWIENCFNRIEEDSSEIAVIGDCRFINEVNAVKKRGGKVVRLLRSVKQGSHTSEVDLDGYNGYDAVINNQDMSIEESTRAFLNAIIALGVTSR